MVSNYTYATFDWAERATEVLNQDADAPKFLYVAFNAPHEKVLAPKELVQEMKDAHAYLNVKIPSTRALHLGAVKGS